MIGGRVSDAKAGGHDTDNFARTSVHENLSSDHRSIPAKSPMPVAVAQDHCFRRSRRLIGRSERSSDLRLHGEGLKQSIADQIREHLFRLGQAGDGDRAGGPDAHGLKRTVLFRVSELHRLRKSQAAAADDDSARPRGDLRQVHKFLGAGKCERLQEDAIDDAKHRRVESQSPVRASKRRRQ